MFVLLFDFSVEFIWARIKTLDWGQLVVVHQEAGEALKDLLLCLKFLVPLHLLNLVEPSSKQLPLSLMAFVLVCLLSVHSPQDVRKVLSAL